MKYRRVRGSFAAILFLLGAASCAGLGDPDRASRRDYHDFQGWQRVTEEPLSGDSPLLGGKHLGSRGLREIYVNDIGQAVYAGQSSTPFASGSVIVKDTFSRGADGSKGQRWNVTVMRKRETGYDPENGDWEYLTMNADLTVRFSGRMKLCIDCHAAAADRDYVFTAP